MPRGIKASGGAPPIDPNDAALAAQSAPGTALAMRGLYHALTPELADKLVTAIGTYPTYRTACAACGVGDKTVTSWLRRGAQAGAADIFADFTARFMLADSEHAKTVYDDFKRLVKSGDSGASNVFKFMATKWRLAEDPELMTLLDGEGKRSDNLQQLLNEPTARLLAMLRLAGWVRHPAWGTVHWGKVLETTGQVAGGWKAPAASE